jgi:hypothetical protein
LRIHVFGVHEEEGSQEKGIGAAIGEPHICLAMEINGLVEPYISCGHEVGEEAGMAGAHRVGDVADTGGGGQHIYIAEVNYVVWRRVVLLSGGYFRHKEVF